MYLHRIRSTSVRRRAVVVAAAVLLGVASLWAHHGLAAFDTTRTVRMEGTVTAVEWVNPHAFIYADLIIVPILLIYGRYWIPAIIDSFETIGQQAAGTGPLAPSDVFTRGIDIAGALMAISSAAAMASSRVRMTSPN